MKQLMLRVIRDLVIFLAVTIIFLVVLAIFHDYNSDYFTRNIPLTIRGYLTCAKKGETTGSLGMPRKCCSGLKSLPGGMGEYNGNCSTPWGGLGVCLDCGDKRCDVNYGENKCNCPEDCK